MFLLQAFGVQSLSGTGALRVGAEFLHRQLKYTTFYYSSPTWGNYIAEQNLEPEGELKLFQRNYYRLLSD
jgi:aspartate/tyrosine/aromatic aminotransferase